MWSYLNKRSLTLITIVSLFVSLSSAYTVQQGTSSPLNSMNPQEEHTISLSETNSFGIDNLEVNELDPPFFNETYLLSDSVPDARHADVTTDGTYTSIVWDAGDSSTSGGPAGTGNIFLRYYNHLAGNWSIQYLISSSSQYGSYEPAIAIDLNHKFHIVWQTFLTPTSPDVDIWYSLWDPSSHTGSYELVTTSSTVKSRWVDIVVDNSGDVHVLWNEFGSGSSVMYKSRNSFSGIWGTTELVSNANVGISKPSLALGASDTLHAVWTQINGTEDDVYYRKRTKAEGWGLIQTVSVESEYSSLDPKVSTDNLNNPYIVWVDSSRHSGTKYDVLLNWIYASNSTLGSQEIISKDEGGVMSLPWIEVDTFGNIHVSWVEENSSTGLTQILYKFKDISVQSWKSTHLVSRSSTTDVHHPAMVVDTSGVHVVWDDTSSVPASGTNIDVFYSRSNYDINPPEVIDVPSAITINFGDDFYLDVNTVSNDNITWQISSGIPFSIDSNTGEITNTTDLPVDIYPIQVFVTNVQEIGFTFSFTVTIKSVTPASINDLFVDPRDTGNRLTWSVFDEGGSTVTSFKIYRSDTTGGPYDTIAEVVDPFYLDESIIKGETYFYVVTSINAFGESGFSNEESSVVYSAPSSPINVIGTIEDTTIQLYWSPPIDDGGKPNLNYSVYRSITNPSSHILIDNKENTNYDDVFSDLDFLNYDGKSVYYYLTAINEIGESEKSEEIEIIFGDVEIITSTSDTTSDTDSSSNTGITSSDSTDTGITDDVTDLVDSESQVVELVIIIVVGATTTITIIIIRKRKS